MSKKAFVISGLVLIQLHIAMIATIMYLAFSRIIDLTAFPTAFWYGKSLLPVFAISILLYFRSKTVTRRKRIWALCIPLFLLATMAGSWLAYVYSSTIVSESGAQDRFFGAIAEWGKSGETGGPLTYTVKQKLDYIFILMPGVYLGNLGFFALLWFGSQDPKTPSKNNIVERIKRALVRRPAEEIKTGRKLNFVEA